jgi:hypothetical protein
MVYCLYPSDLALNKPATQSSTFNKNDLDSDELKLLEGTDKNILYKAGPEMAVNGDMASVLREGSCSHTSLSKNPWWKVDLQSEHIITDVSIQTASGTMTIMLFELVFYYIPLNWDTLNPGEVEVLPYITYKRVQCL